MILYAALEAAVIIWLELFVAFIIQGWPNIVCAIGLLMLKEWARKATIWVYAIHGFFSVIGLFAILIILPKVQLPSNLPLEFVKYLFGISIAGFGVGQFLIILFFLTRPKVKEQFK